ncbi:hypothetical protein BT93_A1321 [Corymbia citriodora subsp. variegata]|nr:hypothetical protein BT93_A1321 [Corymbia citriodora subsp. variegata]
MKIEYDVWKNCIIYHPEFSEGVGSTHTQSQRHRDFDLNIPAFSPSSAVSCSVDDEVESLHPLREAPVAGAGEDGSGLKWVKSKTHGNPHEKTGDRNRNVNSVEFQIGIKKY